MASLYGEEKLCNFQFVTFACRFFMLMFPGSNVHCERKPWNLYQQMRHNILSIKPIFFWFVRHQKHFALDKQQKWKAINTQFHRSKGMIRILLYIFCVSFSTLLLTWQNIQVLDSSTDYDFIWKFYFVALGMSINGFLIPL